MRAEINISISKIIMNKTYFLKELGQVLQASSFIPEGAYVKEAPVNIGDFRQGIRVKRGNNNLEYTVTSTAKSVGGDNYPYFLYTGTYRNFGAPDSGFTVGRVRTNTVARGIGGIRPNKAAKRARDKSERKTINFIKSKLKTISKTQWRLQV